MRSRRCPQALRPSPSSWARSWVRSWASSSACTPRRAPRSSIRSPRCGRSNRMTGLFDGVGIALTSLRAHKMRAALTILGVAIGVTVVMVIGALISGFNKGISDMLASLGPKTFWVGRYWGGQNDDPEDPDPWRRRPPPLTMTEANRLEQLPSVALVVVDENSSADIDFEGHRT